MRPGFNSQLFTCNGAPLPATGHPCKSVAALTESVATRALTPYFGLRANSCGLRDFTFALASTSTKVGATRKTFVSRPSNCRLSCPAIALQLHRSVLSFSHHASAYRSVDRFVLGSSGQHRAELLVRAFESKLSTRSSS